MLSFQIGMTSSMYLSWFARLNIFQALEHELVIKCIRMVEIEHALFGLVTFFGRQITIKAILRQRDDLFTIFHILADYQTSNFLTNRRLKKKMADAADILWEGQRRSNTFPLAVPPPTPIIKGLWRKLSLGVQRIRLRVILRPRR